MIKSSSSDSFQSCIDDRGEQLPYDCEFDCDCCDDYTCELHSNPQRYDYLFVAAMTRFENKIKNEKSTAIIPHAADKFYAKIIAEHITLIAGATTFDERKPLFINLFRFIMSDKGFIDSNYKRLIYDASQLIFNSKINYPFDTELQVLYRDWSLYLLSLEN